MKSTWQNIYFHISHRTWYNSCKHLKTPQFKKRQTRLVCWMKGIFISEFLWQNKLVMKVYVNINHISKRINFCILYRSDRVRKIIIYYANYQIFPKSTIRQRVVSWRHCPRWELGLVVSCECQASSEKVIDKSQEHKAISMMRGK